MKEVRMKREHLLRCLLLPVLLSCLFSLVSLKSAWADSAYASCIPTQHDDSTPHGYFRWDSIDVNVSCSSNYHWELHFVDVDDTSPWRDGIVTQGSSYGGQSFAYTYASDSCALLVNNYGDDFQYHHYYFYVEVFPDDNSFAPISGGFADERWFLDNTGVD